jgi:hypothetical protein
MAAVERHFQRSLDVRAGVELIRDLERHGVPVSGAVIGSWAEFLTGKEQVWSALFEARAVDRFESSLDDDGPPAIARLDWPLVRVLVANREGVSVMETGTKWRDGLPDPAQLCKAAFAEAMRLVEKHVDLVTSCLYMGAEISDGGALLGLENVVEDWLPSAVPSVVARWDWVARRVRSASQTDGLYGSTEAVEAFEAAFAALPLPEAPPERAEVLRLLAFDLPDCLFEGGLAERRDALAEEFGVSDDFGQVSEKAIRAKITKALNKMVPPVALPRPDR